MEGTHLDFILLYLFILSFLISYAIKHSNVLVWK